MTYPHLPEALVAQRDACLTTLQPSGDNHLYAVLDLAALPVEQRWHQLLMRHRAAVNLFQGQPEESASEQAPWLISMATEHNKAHALQRTVDAAFGSVGISWVTSALDLHTLAQRLARRMTVRLPDGDALLRYYDPRLFAGLWEGMPTRTQSAFGAFGDHWWFLDTNLALQGIALAGTPGLDPFEPPLHCSAEQVQVLLHLSERHQMVEFLCKRMPNECLFMGRGQRFDFVTRHDAEARVLQVVDFADRLRYCELALQHGDDFAQQPQWQAVWQRMRVDHVSLRELAREIGSDQIAST